MKASTRIQSMVRNSAALVVAFLTTCLALPVNAASFPNEPLTTGIVAEPNILFLLDDSGSMEWRYMYNPEISAINYTYARSNYQSSATGDGRQTNSDYDAYRYFTNTGTFRDRFDPLVGAVGIYDRNFKTNSLYYNPAIDYQLWMKADGTRYTEGADYTKVIVDANLAGSGLTTVNFANEFVTFFVPKTSTSDLTRATSYYRYQLKLGTSIQRCEYVGTNTGGNWTNCSATFPNASRADLEKEKRNIAIWYSYHRTRMKAAKAGASEVFQALDNGYRIGYRAIHSDLTVDKYKYPIPVGVSNGRFEGANKTSWFNELLGARGDGGTPLRSALDGAGKYFSDPDKRGPYGPEDGTSQLVCRQNFSILTTDGYWNMDSGFNIGDQDGVDGPLISGPPVTAPALQQKGQYKAALPYADASQSNTLADVAMKYWKNDLNTVLANEVPTTDGDQAFWQHMVTFGISIGLKGTLDQSSVARVKADGFPKNNGVKVNWPIVGADRVQNIDDLLHAALNGHGEFISASDPKAFSDGLKAALTEIEKARASGSSIATTTASFEADTFLFKASYTTGIWAGELEALDISNKTLPAQPKWTAAKSIAYAGREVLTAGTGRRLVTFPTSAQEALLQRGVLSGADNAAYIKGDQSKETGANPLRLRSILLGDIVHSSPTYSKNSKTVFVGANDGMLHAFNAADGKEKFAYVPKGLDFTALAQLSNPAYLHSYFVDGPIVITDQARTTGKNYLVATLGRGGKGLFTLDVTDPSPTAMKNFGLAWDNTGGTDGDMGNILGEPLVVKANNGKFVVITGNGIDSTNGSSTLFAYDLVTGDELARIRVDAGTGNGLMAPRSWDSDADGDIDYVFAGDLKGNLWKFDFSNASPAQWGNAYGASPLFKATDSAGAAQPITAGIAIAKEPVNGRLWVFFGTGKFISTSDISTVSVQSVYGIIDGETVIATGAARATALQERMIEIWTGANGIGTRKRAFEAYAGLPDGKKGWFIDFKLPPEDKGERVVSRAQIFNRAMVFPSIIPDSSNPCKPGGRGYINALDAFTGTSLRYQDGSGSFFDTGMDGDRSNDDLSSDGKKLPVGSLDLGVGMPSSPSVVGDRLYTGGTNASGGEGGSGIGTVGINTSGGQRQRVFWRELFRGG